MDVDPVASMRCWAVDIELGGRQFEVPSLPAADWWPVLVSGQPTQVLDLLVSRPDDGLDDMLLDGRITAEDLGQACRDAIEEVSGRTFHAACVLAMTAHMHWLVINGQLARDGFRWDVMPIGAALDAIYSLVLEGLPEKSEDGKRKPREQFLKLLESPGGKQGRDKALADFETIAGPKPTGGVRSTGGQSGNARPRTPPRRRPRHPAAP